VKHRTATALVVGIMVGALMCAPVADAAARRSVASRLASLERRVKALERKFPLSTETPVVQKWLDPETRERIIPDERTTLGMLIFEPDFAHQAELNSFELAFEFDLAKNDPTFHLTHEFIDGKRWPGGPNND